MPVVKNKTTEGNREFWSHVEEITEAVNKWPDWMRNESRDERKAQECSERQVANRESRQV